MHFLQKKTNLVEHYCCYHSPEHTKTAYSQEYFQGDLGGGLELRDSKQIDEDVNENCEKCNNKKMHLELTFFLMTHIDQIMTLFLLGF